MNPPSSIPTIDVHTAVTRLEGGPGEPLLVDVRELHELIAVRAPAAVFMPLTSFALRYRELPRDRPLLIICAAGSRSATATAQLLQSGYTDVVNVAGGMIAWQRAGYVIKHGPIEPDEGGLPSR
jgi:rhodanese-related sulfurtransferase